MNPLTGTLLPMLLPSSPNNSSLKLSSCLPHPGGNSQPFLLSFSAPHLTILLSGVSAVALAPTPRLYLQIRVIPAPVPAAPRRWSPQALGACPAALGLCPALAGVFAVAGENQATAAVLLRIMQRK